AEDKLAFGLAWTFAEIAARCSGKILHFQHFRLVRSFLGIQVGPDGRHTWLPIGTSPRCGDTILLTDRQSSVPSKLRISELMKPLPPSDGSQGRRAAAPGGLANKWQGREASACRRFRVLKLTAR